MQAGDRVDGLRLDLAGSAVGPAALDLHGLSGVREQQSGLDGTHLQAAPTMMSAPGNETRRPVIADEAGTHIPASLGYLYFRIELHHITDVVEFSG